MRQSILIISAVFMLISGLIMSVSSYASNSNEGIAAVVNSEAITMSELNDRIKLIMISSGMPDTPEIRANVQDRALDYLIEEAVKNQQAEELGFSRDEKDIDQRLEMLAAQNKLSKADFVNALEGKGVRISTLRDQIASQLAWAYVINHKLHSQVVVSETDVDDRIARLKQSVGKKEYLLSEIFLNVNQKNPEAQTKKLAQQIYTKISSGETAFSAMARQFSENASAANGGDIGWMSLDLLPTDLVGVVSKLDAGRISAPVRTQRGYYIMGLRSVRTLSDKDIPPRQQILNQIGMERLDRLQQRYFLDLKSAAFIEKRV